jgi:proteasome lid subunit RPN8/RPN11
MAAQSPDPRRGPPDEEPDLHIETIGSWEPVLKELPDLHQQRDAYALAACGRPGDTPKIYVHASALESILDHVRGDMHREVGGVLVGSFTTWNGHNVTDVRTVIRAPQTRASVTHVTFSHETWAAINATMDSDFAEHRIVGWYHSHPNFGIFLSSQDVFTHDNFFDYEGHVALVIDPRRHQIGAFTKREGRVVPAPGLWIAAPKDHSQAPQRYARMLHYAAEGSRRDAGPLGWLRRLLAL